jgi:hypothetical protein
MIGKIIKGKSFKGCISYVMSKENAKILDSEGVLLTDANSIINSFYMQSLMNPNLAKSVGHIPLAYSKDDAEKLTDEFMVKLAKEYMQAMEIKNTQYIIVRHTDRQHPHCHIVFNRVDNDGKTISDKNDRYRNEKVCKQLKDKYNLTYGKGKEKVNVQKLKGTEKTKYEIYHAVKNTLPKVKNWKQLEQALSQQGISIDYKKKGQTGEIQGISFKKDEHCFKGSEIDRQFSFSKIDYCLKQNDKAQDFHIQQEHSHSQNQSSVLENAGSALGGLLDFPAAGSGYDAEEAEFQRQHKLKKKKSKGIRM